MKAICLFVVTVLTAFFFGCSNSSNPATPQENLSPIPIANVPEEGTTILGAGTMNLDTGELVPSRDLSGYLNVKPYIGGNFSYEITNIQLPYIEVEFFLTNPTSYTVWDVALVFENLHGKSLIYGDGYLDIYQPYDPDPVLYFINEEGQDESEFPAYATIIRNGLIVYPAGASPLVDYFIIAHLGGNTGGVKYVDCWLADGELLPEGGSATLAAWTDDFQSDVQMVVADTSQITGGLTFFTNIGNDEWNAEITNSQGATPGDYECWIMAKSPSTPPYNTYAKMEITVSHYPTTLYVDDDNTGGPWDGSMAHPFRYIQDAADYAVEGDTIWVMPGEYHEGEQSDPYSSTNLHIYDLANVTIHGESMPTIIVDQGESNDNGQMIELTGCTNVIFEGFEVTPVHGYERIFAVYGGSGNQIKNCVVTPYAAARFEKFLLASSTTDLIVEGNVIENVNVRLDSQGYTTNFVDFSYNCHNAVFSENTISNLIFDSVPFGNYFRFYLIYVVQSANVSVQKNMISDIGLEVSISEYAEMEIISLLLSNYCTLRNNLIQDIHFTNPADYARIRCISISSSNGAQIYNNTIDSILTTTSNTSESAGIYCSNSQVDLVMHSNIISRILSPENGSSHGVYSADTIYQYFSDVWNVTSARYYWNAAEGEGGLDVDPQFVDYMNDDYHLDPLSECVGAGQDGFDMGCYGGADPLP